MLIDLYLYPDLCLPAETRRFYFVRRTLATLTEIEGAIHKLNSNDEFKSVRRSMPSEHRRGWDAGVKFFARNHSFLNDWRNDVGGHFLDRSAKYAIEAIDEDTVGVIELYRRGKGADMKLPFAYELVAVALTRNRAQQTEREFLNDAFGFSADGVGHAMNPIQIVVFCYLLDRFRS